MECKYGNVWNRAAILQGDDEEKKIKIDGVSGAQRTTTFISFFYHITLHFQALILGFFCCIERGNEGMKEGGEEEAENQFYLDESGVKFDRDSLMCPS